MDDDEDDNEDLNLEYYATSPDDETQRVQKLQVLFENDNHHNGSVYCVDWSRSQRLIASGSNDREIKILVTPNLENEEALNQLLVLVLKGHTAIVRTVCFDPSNDLVLLSGGLSKNYVPKIIQMTLMLRFGTVKLERMCQASRDTREVSTQLR